ncbi:MAG: hypothetical protein ACFCUU_10000 [Cyclobacteriaceae bacterium]
MQRLNFCSSCKNHWFIRIAINHILFDNLVSRMPSAEARHTWPTTPKPAIRTSHFGLWPLLKPKPTQTYKVFKDLIGLNPYPEQINY